jgi:hypothetical protein
MVSVIGDNAGDLPGKNLNRSTSPGGVKLVFVIGTGLRSRSTSWSSQKRSMVVPSSSTRKNLQVMDS